MENNKEMMEVFGDIKEITIEETEDYVIKQTRDGKFKKEQKYKSYMSKVPTTEEEQIELFKVLNSNNSDNENVIELKNMIDEKITIEEVFIQPYQSFDEDTGENNNGVSIVIKDKDTYYATSSKSVYFTLKNLFKVFKFPDEEGYKPITVTVTGTKRQNGVQINLSIVSVGK